MPAAILGPIAGAAVGGLMGGDSSTSQTASKEPWKAAQPWLQSNLDSGQALQNYYQQNPFNQLQQTGYQNQLSNLDNFQQNTAPGLMAFANKLMGSNYQRSPQSNQGAAWMNQGQQGANGGGLLEQGGQAPQQMGGLMGGQQIPQQSPQTASQGPFYAPQSQQYGTIDFAAMNPYNGALKPADQPAAGKQTVDDLVAAEIARQRKEQEDLQNRFA